MRLRRLRALSPVLLFSLVSQLAVTAAVLIAASAAAQDEALLDGRKRPTPKPPRVAMQVAVGHGNATREGSLTPVRVALLNNGAPLLGRLEIRDRHGNHTDTLVDLPRRANKAYTLFVPLAPYDFSSEIGTLTLFEGRKVVEKRGLNPTFDRDRTIVLSVSGEDASLQFLHEANRLEVTPMAPADLPRQWAGYEPANVVALTGRAWSQMDDEQKRAFRIWVEQGGRGILSAESTTEWRDADGLALTGVTPYWMGSDRVLSSTAEWGGTPCRATSGALLTVSGPLAPGSRELSAEDGKPLIVMRKALYGRVLWLGFNPFSEAVRSWEGSESFWRQAIQVTRAARTETLSDSLASVPDAVTAARSLPRLPAPPLAAVLIFGLSYAVIFGPVNIAVLRRLRRTVRAWLFVPALALGMTLVVLFAGQSWGNARTVLNSLSVLHAANGGRTAREETVTGIFSPTNRAFDLSVDDPSAGIRDLGSGSTEDELTPTLDLAWPDHQTDGAMTWNQVALQLFATRVLEHSRPRDLGGSFDIDLKADGSGAVTNGTTLTVRSAYLTRGGRYCWVGDLPVGATISFKSNGWSRTLGKTLAAPRVVGQMRENQVFRESVEQLWRGGRESLLAPAVRKEPWLVGEVAEFRGGLAVADVPFNNRAALIAVRALPTQE
ncbi:MAG: hypothetical protein ACO1SX_09570 [Actinomycetota bacterium]